MHVCVHIFEHPLLAVEINVEVQKMNCLFFFFIYTLV